MGYRKALIGATHGVYSLVEDAEMPNLQSGQMLCKVVAVSPNPMDVKFIDYSPVPGVGGYDFAGVVSKLGEDVTRFKVGDKVFGFTFGLNPNNLAAGSFSDLAIATQDLACHVPDSVSFHEAATMAGAIGTAGYALYKQLQLPTKNVDTSVPTYVLVSGGTSATGRLAIQLLKWSGLSPIATCSAQNRLTLKSLGALETFDYSSATCGPEIKSYTRNTLAHVLDCITTAETMEMCFQAMGSGGGRYTSLDPPPTHVKYTRRDITVDWVMSLSMFGESVALDGVYGRPAIPADRQFAAEWYLTAEKLIADGLLKPPPFHAREGGLAAVQQGIADIRERKTRGKLVYGLLNDISSSPDTVIAL
ncbi:alcohol dehydrogenase GroES-like domain-containing protein [Xylaria intraflava]|nr:alcohol dehydrogenase GroES-like domain-containing protein [Xylaria intraflava]